MVADFSIEGINVDLHEQLHVPWYPFRINIKEVWRAAYKTSEDSTSHRMSSEHLLIYLVTHLYRHLQGHLQKQKPFKFIWFYDIAVVLNVEKNKLDEEKVLNIAKSWDCHEVLCCMIDAVAEAFDLQEAQVIREKAKRYEISRDEAKKALYYTLDPSATNNSPDLSLKFWNPDKQTANASHHILYVLSYLFPSKAYLKSCYPSTYSGLIYARYPQWIIEKLGNKLFRTFK
jgi:hypothetical protein